MRLERRRKAWDLKQILSWSRWWEAKGVISSEKAKLSPVKEGCVRVCVCVLLRVCVHVTLEDRGDIMKRSLGIIRVSGCVGVHMPLLILLD